MAASAAKLRERRWVEKLQIPSSKFQRTSNAQTPNTKLQTPEKLQAPNSKLEARAAVWSLELGISLVFGAWLLVFRFRDFSGGWGLVLGVSLSGGPQEHLLASAV